MSHSIRLVLAGLFALILLGAAQESAPALPTIVGFATFDSIGHAIMIPASYLVITTIQSSVISPIKIADRFTAPMFSSIIVASVSF